MGNLSKKQITIIIIAGLVFIIVVVGYLYSVYSNEEVLIEEQLEVSEDYQQNSIESGEVVVHIAGEVNNPGIINVGSGSRIADVVEKAEGFTKEADISNVNLAYIVQDGQKITIPKIKDDENGENESKENIEHITQENGNGIIKGDIEQDNSIGIVNINQATQTELEQLPGIGPSTAIKIVTYRKTNGKFKNIEDIKNVSGIGESKFEKIKNYIRI